VLVPDEYGVAALAGVPGRQVQRYDSAGTLPDELTDEMRCAEVLVAPILGPARPELVAALPRLRLVQLLTAGYETWAGALPDGVAIVNTDLKVLWANPTFERWAGSPVPGRTFYDALGSPEVLGLFAASRHTRQDRHG